MAAQRQKPSPGPWPRPGPPRRRPVSCRHAFVLAGAHTSSYDAGGPPVQADHRDASTSAAWPIAISSAVGALPLRIMSRKQSKKYVTSCGPGWPSEHGSSAVNAGRPARGAHAPAKLLPWHVV